MTVQQPTGTILDYMAGGAEDDVNMTPNTAIFKDGTKAEHPFGVLYQAPWHKYADGFCEHSRRVARALSQTGLPLQMRAIDASSTLDPDPEAQAQIEDLLHTSIERYSVGVYQFTGTSIVAKLMVPPFAYLSDEELRLIRRAKVLYTVLERDRIERRPARMMNLAGQVWTACKANVEALVESGVKREQIRVVPIPHFPADPILKLVGRRRKPGPPRLYHIGKWEPRKAQHEMLGVFLRAFKPGEAHFYIKTAPLITTIAGYPQNPTASIGIWLKDERVIANGWDLSKVNRNVFFVVGRLSEEKLRSLHDIGDVYVTLSRGEGFEMSAYDAKLAANRMVYTPSGGPPDFAGPGDLLVPASGKIACHAFYEWGPDDKYLDYDLDVAAEKMRASVVNLPTVHVSDVDLSDFTAEAVGKRARGYLEELAASFGGRIV